MNDMKNSIEEVLFGTGTVKINQKSDLQSLEFEIGI